MDESEPVATQHLMRALDARDRRDFDTAIAELDACLCSDPIPRTGMDAWNELAFIIMMKFDFPNRDGSSISDEEFMWHSRAARCVRNAVALYEDILAHTDEADECRKTYEIAKGRANSMMAYGSASKDASGNPRLRGTAVFYQVVIPPLNCLAEQESHAREEARQKYGPKPKSKPKESEPDNKAGCFIATAVYGSPLAPGVLEFRRFRDEVLLPSKRWRVFVSFYYFVSPPAASFISRHRFLRTMTRRILLRPILRLTRRNKGNHIWLRQQSEPSGQEVEKRSK